MRTLCYKNSIVRRLLILWNVLLAFAGCARTQAFDYSRESDPSRQEFVIGISDVLRISVWHMPELSGDAKVRPDGTLTMPLLGDFTVAGRTPAALRAEIEFRLKSFVKEESVSVSVAVSEVNSYYFTIAGNAEHQGLFTAHRFVKVTEAVALAGGANRFAALSRAVLIRPSATGPRRIPIDLAAIYSGERPEMNLTLIAGDTLHLP